MPSSRWVFEGFLPRSGAERTERLEAVAVERRIVVMYEAPHRLHRTLIDLESMCGAQRRIVVAAELTKVHEHLWRGNLHDATRHFAGDDLRGEFVLVLDGAAPAAPPTDDEIIAALRAEIAAGGWYMAPADADIIFTAEAYKVWPEMIKHATQRAT